MAKLDESCIENLRTAIHRCNKPWILAAYCIDSEKSSPALLEGTIGFFDWRLHGQISRLVKRNQMQPGSLTLVPSQRHLGKASLLVYAAGKQDDVEKIASALKKLNATQLCVAEETLPNGLMAKLKKSLAKAGIEWSPLLEAQA